MDAHAVALAEDLVRLDRGGVQAPADEVAKTGDERRVVAVLGDVDDDRRAAVVDVPAPQHAHVPGPGAAEQRGHGAAQVLDGGAEQLLLGEGVEQRHGGLEVVRALDQLLGGEDGAQLAVQERHLAGRLGVGLAREQPDETGHARRGAVVPEPADDDVVHARAPVDGRQLVGLADAQQVARGRTPVTPAAARRRR